MGQEKEAMSKKAFFTAYEQELKAAYHWASDETKLRRFMQSVEDSMTGPLKTWNHDGDCVTAAWRAIGGKGKPSFKALRALSDN